ncbi:MAG TPA: hypothetical protein EYN28_04575 [Flavobacteriales bacterium]|nr:hypothetical protein [Flavobacteriales bacterium]
MIFNIKRLLGAVAILMVTASAFSQCTSCLPDYTCVANGYPVLCPQLLPDGTTGIVYETTATFNMPGTVTDPGSGVEASLESVTITSITGLPYGLTLTPSNPDGVYYPAAGENFGCATICGTPLAAGQYFVNINVTVVASAFGFSQTVNESFSLPLTILQGAGGGNASFSTSETTGCAPLTVDVTNTITGPGVSYTWDFGGPSSGTSLAFDILTDDYPGETTWLITDETGGIVMSGGPYALGQTLYSEIICVGPGNYTLSVNDSYGDGMQYGGVIGNYVLTDGAGVILAEIVAGGNFGAQGLHPFTIAPSSAPGGCILTTSNPTIVYDTPGTYNLSLTTTVTELTLIGLNITTLAGGWDGDVEEFFWGAPDPFFVMGGDASYTSDWVGDVETPNFTGLSIPLNYGGTYSFSFYDEDDVSANDFLGTANFVASAPGEYTINGGGTTAILSIIETVSAEFVDTEVIIVFESLDVWADIDGDGYGDLSMPVNGCDPMNTTPYAFNSEDCNDADALMFPGGAGTFSGIDNDCNSLVEGDELMAVEGCMDVASCNFNAEANVDDGSCEYVSCAGCTDPLAINYNPTATLADGSCEYTVCLGDFNNDGVVTVSDLLELLSSFGCTSNCANDLTGDNLVTVADLLQILSVFGLDCP